MSLAPAKTHLLSLPTEIRLSIFEYVVLPPYQNTATRDLRGVVSVPDHQTNLSILTICRQFRSDFTSLVFSRTIFKVSSYAWTDQILHTRLARLRSCQVGSIRYLVVNIEDLDIHLISQWSRYPFNYLGINLTDLTITMGSIPTFSGKTRDIANMLRRLRNVQTLRIRSNDDAFSRGFRAWYNRLVGLILKEDHQQRYDVPDAPRVEETWWEWEFNVDEQSAIFRARKPKPVVQEQEYMLMIKPLMETWISSVEME